MYKEPKHSIGRPYDQNLTLVRKVQIFYELSDCSLPICAGEQFFSSVLLRLMISQKLSFFVAFLILDMENEQN